MVVFTERPNIISPIAITVVLFGFLVGRREEKKVLVFEARGSGIGGFFLRERRERRDSRGIR